MTTKSHFLEVKAATDTKKLYTKLLTIYSKKVYFSHLVQYCQLLFDNY